MWQKHEWLWCEKFHFLYLYKYFNLCVYLCLCGLDMSSLNDVDVSNEVSKSYNIYPTLFSSDYLFIFTIFRSTYIKLFRFTCESTFLSLSQRYLLQLREFQWNFQWRWKLGERQEWKGWWDVKRRDKFKGNFRFSCSEFS
jgi:hypothetical protein